MQVESVLEFRLNQDIYCFNTKQIRYVFDLDVYENITGMDESVVGIVRYNDDMMLLIDTLHLYNKEEYLDLSTQKSVVVIKDKDSSLYGMLVDEIIKIEDVEIAPVTLNLSNEEVVINHYKENNLLINEIAPLPLLHVKKIPAFKKEIVEVKNTKNFDKSEFLLFTIQDKYYAVEAFKVKEVVLKEGPIFELEQKDMRYKGALSIRDEVVKVANIEPESQKEDVIVIEHKGDRFCIDVDDVLDIEEFDIEKIESLNNPSSYIKAFYNFRSNIVGIIDIEYFVACKDEDIDQIEENSKEVIRKKEGYLVFDIADKKFALDMHYIRQVMHTQDISKTKSSLVGLNSFTEFIATWNHHAVDVIKLDKIFEFTTNQDDSQVIIIGDDHYFKGILVDNVEDILYIEKNEVSHSSSESIIDGAIVYEEQLIPKLNPLKVIQFS